MYHLLPRQDPPANDKPQTGTDDSSNPPAESGGGGGGGGGMSPVGIVMLVLFIFLLFGGVGYIVYSQLRARRLGLPAPSWRSYIPFLNNSRSRSTRPSTGPLGWIKSKTTSTGGGFSIGGPTGYTGAAVRSERTRAQFNQVRQDDDEAWDSRGYREFDLEDDTEMQRGRGTQVTGGYDGVTTYGNSGLRPNDEEAPRGRSRSRDPPYPSAETAAPAPARQQRFSKPQPRSSMDSFTGVSVKGGRVSMDGERRSVFREAM